MNIDNVPRTSTTMERPKIRNRIDYSKNYAGSVRGAETVMTHTQYDQEKSQHIHEDLDSR